MSARKIFVQENGDPISFYLPPFKGKRELESIILRRGGHVEKESAMAMYSIVPVISSSITKVEREKLYNTDFIHECIDAGKLLDIRQYSFAPKTTPGSKTKKKFTMEDDLRMKKFVQVSNMGLATEMRCWRKAEEEKVTEHSAESMRGRWRKILLPRYKAELTAGRTTAAELVSRRGSRGATGKPASGNEEESEEESEEEGSVFSSPPPPSTEEEEVVNTVRRTPRTTPAKRSRSEAPACPSAAAGTSQRASKRARLELPLTQADMGTQDLDGETDTSSEAEASPDGGDVDEGESAQPRVWWGSQGGNLAPRTGASPPPGGDRRPSLNTVTEMKSLMRESNMSLEVVTYALMATSGDPMLAKKFLAHAKIKGFTPWLFSEDNLILKSTDQTFAKLSKMRSKEEIRDRVAFMDACAPSDV